MLKVLPQFNNNIFSFPSLVSLLQLLLGNHSLMLPQSCYNNKDLGVITSLLVCLDNQCKGSTGLENCSQNSDGLRLRYARKNVNRRLNRTVYPSRAAIPIQYQ